MPTTGRPSLERLLEALAASAGPLPECVFLVDDRTSARAPLQPRLPPRLQGCVRVLAAGGRGPAAARNVGWRAAAAPWVVFVDDDVVPGPSWLDDLARDIDRADGECAGVQGRLRVPLADGLPPSDWERNVAGLESAAWATADMAYRRDALTAVGGFDERFPRAYREDCDLALRVLDGGRRLTVGERAALHPVRPASPWISLRLAAGNSDDVLMWLVHGPSWRVRGQAPAGRRPWHLATTAAWVAALLFLAGGRRRVAASCAAVALSTTAEFAYRRIAPGPKTRPEVVALLVTSALLPPLCTWHWLRGWYRWAGMLRRPRPARRWGA